MGLIESPSQASTSHPVPKSLYSTALPFSNEYHSVELHK